jgi:hypothetical protein
MSFRRKTRDQLLSILHTYRSTVADLFGDCDIDDLKKTLAEYKAIKLKEFKDGLFSTMHPRDLGECIDIVSQWDKSDPKPAKPAAPASAPVSPANFEKNEIKGLDFEKNEVSIAHKPYDKRRKVKTKIP